MSVKLFGLLRSPCLIVLALTISLICCGKTEKPSVKVFATPDEAGSALLAAAKAGDTTAALAIFGPDSKELGRDDLHD